MNHFVEIKEIEIPDVIHVVSDMFPESGFFMVKCKNHSDLVFVNKDENNCFFICPESIYKSLGIDMPVLPKQEEVTNMSTYISTGSGYVSEDFVITLSKILLNNKK
ncbi:hypothetical protein ACVVIH_13035 [Chryseobacterium arthrosphaerae]